MKEVRFFYVPDAATQTELPQEEATHALRVLRIQAGDELFLMDGKGGVLPCRSFAGYQQTVHL